MANSIFIGYLGPVQFVAGGGGGLTFPGPLTITTGPLVVTNGNIQASNGQFLASPNANVAIPGYAFVGDPNTGMGSPSADVLIFSTNGLERMRILGGVAASGFVGIGTTTPGQKLHVAGTPSLLVHIGDTLGTAAKYMLIDNLGGSMYMGVESSVAGAEFPGSLAYASIFTSGGTSPLQFGVSNNIKATLLNAGFFGIGKTNPAYSLDAAGSINYDVALRMLGKLMIAASGPAINSGFGAGASVVTFNGTFAFTINVGTGGVATSGVIGFPAAANGWHVTVTDITNPATSETVQTTTGPSQVTITNYSRTTGLVVAWASGDVLLCSARAY